jgi:hypothetical protein
MKSYFVVEGWLEGAAGEKEGRFAYVAEAEGLVDAMSRALAERAAKHIEGVGPLVLRAKAVEALP